jgi:ParB family chromosome partitioning protein
MPGNVSAALVQRRANKPAADSDFQGLFAQSAKKSAAKVISVPISQLTDFPDQPFKPYTPDRLSELAGSIEEHGLLNPIRVRPAGKNQYQILAGRNRKNACILLGWTEIDATVEDCDDDTARLIMLTSNLCQRQKLLPSEKAFAYKMQMDILRRQGKRTDLAGAGTSAQSAWKRETAWKLAEQTDTSKDDIRRHIRLTRLLPELLDAVDCGTLPFMGGIALSGLSPENQAAVLAWMNMNGDTLSVGQAKRIKKAAEDSDLTVKSLTELFAPLPKPSAAQTFTVSRKKWSDYADVLPRDNAGFEALFARFLDWLREQHLDGICAGAQKVVSYEKKERREKP